MAQFTMKGGGDVKIGNNGAVDLESQTKAQRLYPNQMETPQLRWAFIRKVYAIISFQLALTIGVAAVVVSVRAIPEFFIHTTPGIISFVCIALLTVAISISLWFLHKKHPWNYVLLILFTIAKATLIGLCCAFKQGKLVMLAVILTTVVVVGLTAYTFWAVKRGQDFQFLGPFLFAASLMLITFALIQIFWPLGPISRTVFAALAGLLACGYIVYDTDDIIKRLSYDEYIMGALSIYVDIVQLFLSILALLTGRW